MSEITFKEKYPECSKYIENPDSQGGVNTLSMSELLDLWVEEGSGITKSEVLSLNEAMYDWHVNHLGITNESLGGDDEHYVLDLYYEIPIDYWEIMTGLIKDFLKYKTEKIQNKEGILCFFLDVKKRLIQREFLPFIDKDEEDLLQYVNAEIDFWERKPKTVSDTAHSQDLPKFNELFTNPADADKVKHLLKHKGYTNNENVWLGRSGSKTELFALFDVLKTRELVKNIKNIPLGRIVYGEFGLQIGKGGYISERSFNNSPTKKDLDEFEQMVQKEFK